MPYESLIVTVFLFFAVAMCLLVSFTIYVPGTPLDAIWKLRKGAAAKIHYYGQMVAPILLTLSAALFVVGVGMIKRQKWAIYTAMVFFVLNGAADAIRMFKEELFNGITGVLVTLIFLWLLLVSVKMEYFAGQRTKNK